MGPNWGVKFGAPGFLGPFPGLAGLANVGVMMIMMVMMMMVMMMQPHMLPKRIRKVWAIPTQVA